MAEKKTTTGPSVERVSDGGSSTKQRNTISTPRIPVTNTQYLAEEYDTADRPDESATIVGDGTKISYPSAPKDDKEAAARRNARRTDPSLQG